MTEKSVTLSAVIADLENGLQRADIKKKYSLTGKEMQVLFKHPKLIGKKAKKVVTLNIIDDIENVISEEHLTEQDKEFAENNIEEICKNTEDKSFEEIFEEAKEIPTKETLEIVDDVEEEEESEEEDLDLDNPFK